MLGIDPDAARPSGAGAMMIEDFVDSKHLTADAILDAHRRFTEDEYKSLILDNFFSEKLIFGLRACFAGDATFEPHFGLNDADPEADILFVERAVLEREFNEAPDASLLAREMVMTGIAHGRAKSLGWTSHMLFTRLLKSEAFATYLTQITGIDGLDEMGYMPRIMRHGDFCRVHDDTAEGRRLCMLFYVDDGWRPGFGGRFQHVIGGAVTRSVDPLGNRLLIHTPDRRHLHQVEPFADGALAWERWTYSIWFSSRAS